MVRFIFAERLQALVIECRTDHVRLLSNLAEVQFPNQIRERHDLTRIFPKILSAQSLYTFN